MPDNHMIAVYKQEDYVVM